MHSPQTLTEIRYYTSPDGITWTYEKTTTGETAGVSPNGRLSLGSDGTNVWFFDGNDGAGSSIWLYSADPILGTWTAMTTPPSAWGFTNGVHTIGSASYVNGTNGTPSSGFMFKETTDNGINWTNVGTTALTLGTFAGVSFARTSYGLYSLDNLGQVITSSTMAGPWTLAVDFGTALAYYGIFSMNDTLYILRSGASTINPQFSITLFSSTDGVTWIEVNPSGMISPNIIQMTSTYPLTQDYLVSSSWSTMTPLRVSHTPNTEMFINKMSHNYTGNGNSQVHFSKINAMRVK